MTTQRRPHWDDDLIDAVFKALSYTYLAQGWAGGIAIDLDESVYPLIAAVEDWHKAKRDQRVRTHSAECWRWHQECAEYRIEKLSARVQAVREFCAATNPIRGELHMAALHGWDTAMEMVLQLLESGEIKGFAFRIANLEGRVDE